MLALAMIVTAPAGCQRDLIVSVEPEDAPGQSAPTLETLLGPGEVDSWVDSVFGGFSGASNALFMWASEEPSLASHSLFRFGFIIDSLIVVDTLSGTLRFDSARVVVRIDTLRTELASGGTTIQLVSVAEDWDAASTTWDFAVDSPGVTIPWSTAGGTFGQVFDAVVLTEVSDSITFQLGAASDSLINLWLDTTQVNTGLALVVSDSGLVSSFLPRLRYEIVPEVTPDTAITISVLADASTFVFDPPAPTPALGVLRLGGIDGWRSFIEFSIPDSISTTTGETATLKVADISLAQLELVSLAAPDPPFAAETGYTSVAVELADDFQVFGAKTPVGSQIDGSEVTIDPDSLESGSTIAVDVTELIQTWADIPFDSIVPPIRIVLRALPEAATFGYWEFDASNGDSTALPLLRVVFTPSTNFLLP